MSEWIKVSDRLPETNLGSVYKYSEVLAVLTTHINYPTTARLEKYSDGSVYWYCLLTHGQPIVTHWMPLPEQPQE